MRVSREQFFEGVGGLFGAAIAFGYFALASSVAGRAGTLVLVLSVPVGVVLGWLLAKLLVFAHRGISEDDWS